MTDCAGYCLQKPISVSGFCWTFLPGLNKAFLRTEVSLVTDEEYLDAVKYILNKLKEIEAFDVIKDITQVTAGKVPEEELFIDNHWEQEFSISTQRLRELTWEEKYMVTIEILENCINTTPRIFNKVACLFNTPLNKIKWEYDKSDDFIAKENNLLGHLTLNISPEEENQIEKNISKLKAFAGRGWG